MDKIVLDRCGVPVADHCNLSCTSCNHLSPLFRPGFMEPPQFAHSLSLMARHLHFGHMSFQGGEPLLHKEIDSFLKLGKESEIADEIHILTNGTLLHRMTPRFWDLVDVVRISSYPGVQIPTLGPDQMKKVRITEFPFFNESFSTIRNEDPALVRKIKESCYLYDRCHAYWDGHFYKCIVSAFLPYGVKHEALLPPTLDGIEITDRPSLRTDLEAYVANKNPLKACEFCAGTSGSAIPHSMSKRSEWLSRHHRPILEQLRPDFQAT